MQDLCITNCYILDAKVKNKRHVPSIWNIYKSFVGFPCVWMFKDFVWSYYILMRDNVKASSNVYVHLCFHNIINKYLANADQYFVPIMTQRCNFWAYMWSNKMASIGSTCPHVWNGVHQTIVKGYLIFALFKLNI